MKGYNMTNNKNNNPAYNWDLYLKQCQEVAASSITPYEIIPYKKYNGIKQAIVKKQNTFKEALIMFILFNRSNLFTAYNIILKKLDITILGFMTIKFKDYLFKYLFNREINPKKLVRVLNYDGMPVTADCIMNQIVPNINLEEHEIHAHNKAINYEL